MVEMKWWVNYLVSILKLVMLFCFGINITFAQTNSADSYLLKQIDDAYAVNAYNPDSALKIIRKVVHRIDRFSQSKYLGHIYICEGKVLLEKGQYKDAIVSFTKSASFTQDSSNLCIIYNNIGNAYNYLGSFDKASQAYLKAIELGEKYPNKNFPVCNVYYNLCTVFDQLKQYDKLNRYIDKGIEVAYQHDESEAIANFLMMKALHYTALNEYDKSLRYLDSSIEISQKYNKPISLHAALSNKGHVYLRIFQPQKAIEALLKAEEVMQKSTINKNNIVSVYASLGDAYLQLKDPAHAKKYIKMAWEQSDSLPKEQMFLLKKKSELEMLNGNGKRAYDYLIAYHELKDSIGNIDVKNNVNKLETQFRTAEKDKTIALNQMKLVQKEQQITVRNFWLVITALSIISLLVLGITGYVQYKNRINYMALNAETKELKARMEGEEAERFRLARDLHDGVNSQLTGAAAYLEVLAKKYPTLSGDDYFTTVQNVITNTGNEVRQISHNLASKQLITDGLDQAVFSFIETIQPSTDTVFEVQCYGSTELLNEEANLHIYRIIQELTHNIIKHAAATEAIIVLNLTDERVSLSVEDNGKGISLKGKQEGIGLSNIRQRIKALNGTMDMESKGKGTQIHIEIPV